MLVEKIKFINSFFIYGIMFVIIILLLLFTYNAALLKIAIMKKNLLILLLAGFAILYTTSCSKNTPDPAPAYDSVAGTWTGFYTPNIGPSKTVSFNFKTGGTLDVSIAPDTGNGTWVQTADSVTGNYTLTGSTTVYSFKGKYTSSQKNMDGTIGLDPSTSGAAVFTITKN
jgi:hypothetical protein